MIDRVFDPFPLFLILLLSVRERSIPRDMAGAFLAYCFSVEFTAFCAGLAPSESLCGTDPAL